MPTNVDVPSLGESVTEAVLLRWIKNDGDAVAKDDPLAELETDKANVDLPAPAAGVLRTAKSPGETVRIGETVARIEEGSGDGAGGAGAGGNAKSGAKTPSAPTRQGTAPASTPQRAAPPASPPGPATSNQTPAAPKATPDDFSPAVRRLLEENNLDPAAITASGPSGRLTKEDVEKHLASRGGFSGPADQAQREAQKAQAPSQPGRSVASPPASSPAAMPASRQAEEGFDENGIKRVPMSKIRKKIAERLVQAQHTAAILTTFNEVDMQAIFDLRAKYKEKFEKTHGVGLGFMSFFARAVVQALRAFPRVNGRIDGDDVIYQNFVHLGIAVSTERGLAVPVLRNVERMSFATIESEIKRLATAARDGKLGLNEISGSTFTITNGGVFGSLLSTPILNPPESGILGMHAIQKRAVVVNDKIEIRPMMYVALSYDHRLVDGRESVSFLVKMKECLEDPARLMLEV